MRLIIQLISIMSFMSIMSFIQNILIILCFWLLLSLGQPEQAGRQRAKATARPVIIPNVLRQAAQGDVARVIRDFDRSYLQEKGFSDTIVPNTDGHWHDCRSRLKRKATDISQSCCEVFAYLTFDTSQAYP